MIYKKKLCLPKKIFAEVALEEKDIEMFVQMPLYPFQLILLHTAKPNVLRQ